MPRLYRECEECGSPLLEGENECFECGWNTPERKWRDEAEEKDLREKAKAEDEMQRGFISDKISDEELDEAAKNKSWLNRGEWYQLIKRRFRDPRDIARWIPETDRVSFSLINRFLVAQRNKRKAQISSLLKKFS